MLYPEQKDLARIYQRLLTAGYLNIGASDHGVSKALYLSDPPTTIRSRSGPSGEPVPAVAVELYWDRPRERWPTQPDGSLMVYTRPLNLDDLLKATDQVEPPA